MYVVTFYSYRGGVGRTMALANTAVELAKRGRKVLIVDFDLEAPGISTFDFCKSNAMSKGLVDYICEYKETSQAPKVNDFIQHCELRTQDTSADFWIMSAGRQDEHYAEKFQSLNWEHLYAERAGFLLMENLKEQWNDYLRPDYVFIDSRTGHTDISGICTRQLPDAVVFTFFPNLQNLAGLKQVVRETRQEGKSGRNKSIQTHFVASNVPDIDDESGILRDHLEKFKSALGYGELNIIRYYNSLSIVNQDIFTLVKPNTTLAKEYVKLSNSIIRGNPADRDGALSYVDDMLEKVRKNRRKFADDPSVTKRMEEITKSHPSDGKVHAVLANLYFQLGLMDQATTEYEEAIKTNGETSDVLMSLSFLYSQRNRREEAVSLLLRMTEKPSADLDIQIAILQLLSLDVSAIPIALKSEGVRNLGTDGRLKLAPLLRTKLELLPYAMELLGDACADNSIDEEARSTARGNMTLCKIAMGRFDEALRDLGDREEIASSKRIHDVFNYAMAEWGLTHSAPADLFGRVAELSTPLSEGRDANFAQCLAIATHLAGDSAGALDWLSQARELAIQQRNQSFEFNCWSYLNTTIAEFIVDLEKIRRMLTGDHILPAFMSGETPSLH